MENGGLKHCSKFDMDRITPHIPLDYRKYLTGECTVETSPGPGSGAYQGYDVLRINYEFNKGAPHTKVFPVLLSTYSTVLKRLIQVSAVVYYDMETYSPLHPGAKTVINPS